MLALPHLMRYSIFKGGAPVTDILMIVWQKDVKGTRIIFILPPYYVEVPPVSHSGLQKVYLCSWSLVTKSLIEQ